MLRFLCKKCGQRLKVGDGDVGRKIRCPGCNYGTAVPPIKLNAKTYHFEYSVCDTVGAAVSAGNAASGQSSPRGTPVPNSSETVLGIKSPVGPARAKTQPDQAPAEVPAQLSLQIPGPAALSADITEPDLKPGQQPQPTVPASAQPLRPGARLAPSPADPARYQAALRPSRARTAALRLRPTARPPAAPMPTAAPAAAAPSPKAPVPETKATTAETKTAVPVPTPLPAAPVAASVRPVASAPAKPSAQAVAPVSTPPTGPTADKPVQRRPGALLAPVPKDMDRYRLVIEASKAKTLRLSGAGDAPTGSAVVVGSDSGTDTPDDTVEVIEPPEVPTSTESDQVLVGEVGEVIQDDPDQKPEGQEPENRQTENQDSESQKLESQSVSEPAEEPMVEASASEPVEAPVAEERPETPTRIERPEVPVLIRRSSAPRPSPRPDAPRPIINRRPDLSAPLRDDRVLAAGRSIDPVVKSLEAGGFAGAPQETTPLSPADLPEGFPAPGDSAAFDPAEALRMLADAVSGQSGVEPAASVPVHEPEEAEPAETVSQAEPTLPVFELDDDEEEDDEARPAGRPAPTPADPARYSAAIAASKAKHP